MLHGGGGNLEQKIESAKAAGAPQEALDAIRRKDQARKEEEIVRLWPENVRPVRLAMGMWTQWRVSMNGPVGFDYAVLPLIESRIGLESIPADEEAECFEGFQIIERELLSEMARKRKK